MGLSAFSGWKAPLQWLYGQPPWHTPETEHNGYPQFTGGFTPIMSMWVRTFTRRNGVDVGCPQLPCAPNYRVCVLCVCLVVCVCLIVGVSVCLLVCLMSLWLRVRLCVFDCFL